MKTVQYIFALLALTFFSSCIHSKKNNEIDYTYNQSKTLGVKFTQISPFDIEFVQFNYSNETHVFIPDYNNIYILDENEKLIKHEWYLPSMDTQGLKAGESMSRSIDVYNELWCLPEGTYYVYYDDPDYKIQTNKLKIKFKKEKYLRPGHFTEKILDVSSQTLNDSIFELTITNMHKYAIPLDSVYIELAKVQSCPDTQEQKEYFILPLKPPANKQLPKMFKPGKPVLVQINLAMDLRDKTYTSRPDFWEFYLLNKVEDKTYFIDYDQAKFYPNIYNNKHVKWK